MRRCLSPSRSARPAERCGGSAFRPGRNRIFGRSLRWNLRGSRRSASSARALPGWRRLRPLWVKAWRAAFSNVASDLGAFGPTAIPISAFRRPRRSISFPIGPCRRKRPTSRRARSFSDISKTMPITSAFARTFISARRSGPWSREATASPAGPWSSITRAEPCARRWISWSSRPGFTRTFPTCRPFPARIRSRARSCTFPT